MADVHSRVQQLMMEANEKLPDYAPSPAKSLHEKSLREKLNESWQGKGYYARLMAQMASPSPARPNMRPPHMQRLHQGANGAAAAANKAKTSEAAKQQAALATMSGAALNGFGGGDGFGQRARMEGRCSVRCHFLRSWRRSWTASFPPDRASASTCVTCVT